MLNQLSEGQQKNIEIFGEDIHRSFTEFAENMNELGEEKISLDVVNQAVSYIVVEELKNFMDVVLDLKEAEVKELMKKEEETKKDEQG